MTGMVGWVGDFPDGKRPKGIHPWALVGAPPEHREWKVGDRSLLPEISGTALVDAFCTIDAGMPGLHTTRIGNWTWLQKRVHVGHNAWIGNQCEICVGTVICGEAHIGDNVKIGGNSWVKPKVRIGHGAVIGGGSVVTRDVPEHEVWAGNPARYLKKAWTHPDYYAMRGLEGRERVKPQYELTTEQWEAARNAVGYPKVRDIEEYHELEQGLGAGHRGDVA